MKHKFINPTGSAYSQALELTKYERLVFVSGQVPADEDDVVPVAFKDQCELAWKNVQKQLQEAEMDLNNIPALVGVLHQQESKTRDCLQLRFNFIGRRWDKSTTNK